MATLTGNKVKDTYTSLLKLDTNGLTSTLKSIEDGAGVVSAIKLSTDTVEVDGTLSFTAAPATDAAELTVLLVDSSNNVVKRELSTVAFTGTASQSFANPMFVLRPTAYALVDTPATPSMAGVNNNSTTASYIFNDASNTHLQTSSTTAGAITIERAGAIKIEVNFILEISSQNTDVTIRVYRKPAGGAAAAIETVVRSNVATGVMAIGFSLFTHCAADEDIYYQIGKNTGGGGTLNTNSTFTVTKLD
mgnify:FL=1